MIIRPTRKNKPSLSQHSTLDEWLDWQMTLHPKEIELGLSRCRAVAERLDLLNPTFPMVSIAGTNGKGSSATMLNTILTAAGYSVGCYTSPHLFKYNERVVINAQPVSDELLCQAFEKIEEARKEISLTYFEFGTLATMWLFQQAQIDLAILEVGLGGRLDAVNIFSANIALITTIDIDHTDWLGSDRESIGFEKAGIFRSQRPVVCSDPQPPLSMITHAQKLGAPFFCLGQAFSYQREESCWQWHCDPEIAKKLNSSVHKTLVFPNLVGEHQLQNAAGVMMVLALLSSQFFIDDQAIERGLTGLQLPGRFQKIVGKTTQLFDVAHNPSAAAILKQQLRSLPCAGRTLAVVSILKDKDILSMLNILKGEFDAWYVAKLNTPRSVEVDTLVSYLKQLDIEEIYAYDSIAIAHQQALADAQEEDRVVIFGSFYTVSELLTKVNT